MLLKRKQSFIFGLIVFLISSFLFNSTGDLRNYHFSNLKARNIGPAIMSGRITAICVDPENSNLIYIGTAGGGVWKSEDQGVTFRPIFDRFCQSIGAIAIDPQNPRRIWVGTGEAKVRNSVGNGDGIYLSEDGGQNWKKMGLEKSERIAKIVIDPKNSNRIWVAVPGELFRDSEERGLFLSEDGGKSWQKKLFINATTGCVDLAHDPSDPEIIYAAMWQFRRWPWFFSSGGPGSGLFKSSDGGKTFTPLKNGLPDEPLGRMAIAVPRSRPEKVYLLVEAEKKGGLYVSEDRGNSFKLINSSNAVRSRPFYFSNIAVDPDNPDRIYVSGVLLAKSIDGGKSFSTISYSGLNYHPDIHPIWINPRRPNQLIVGSDGGIYFSFNSGETFLFQRSLPVSQFYHLAADNRLPYWVYGGLQDNGNWTGPSASYRGKIASSDWTNISGADGFYCQPHPEKEEIVYFSCQGGNLNRFDRLRKQIKEIKPLSQKSEPEYRFNWNAPFTQSRHHPDTIYYGAQFLFKSTDCGDSWKKISPDLTTNNAKKLRQRESGGITRDVTSAENHCTLYTIAESPLNPEMIWTGSDDGIVSLTLDGGKSWKNLTKRFEKLPADSWCSQIEAGRFNPAEAFVVFDNHRIGDKNAYIFYTDDYGNSWTNISNSQIKHYAITIRQDFRNPNILYLGTAGGLYISFNKGKEWLHLNETLPPVEIYDLNFQERENDLLIATHGRGIWIIDDLTPIQSITPEVVNQQITLLPSRQAREFIIIPSQEFLGDGEFNAANPPEGFQIAYFLKQRHIVGDFLIEILDQNKNPIKTIPPGKSAGFNRVSWNLRLAPPKIGGYTSAYSLILQGPEILPGDYLIRIRLQNESIEAPVKYEFDPSLNISQQDRLIQHNTLKKLANLIENCGYMVTVLVNLKTQTEKLIETIPVRETFLKNNLRTYGIYLTQLLSNITRGEKSFEEERVREKLIALYKAIDGYKGKPADSQFIALKNYETELANYQYAFKNLTVKRFYFINRLLQAKKYPLLNVLSFESYIQDK